jgi:hypothetical protein
MQTRLYLAGCKYYVGPGPLVCRAKPPEQIVVGGVRYKFAGYGYDPQGCGDVRARYEQVVPPSHRVYETVLYTKGGWHKRGPEAVTDECGNLPRCLVIPACTGKYAGALDPNNLNNLEPDGPEFDTRRFYLDRVDCYAADLKPRAIYRERK